MPLLFLLLLALPATAVEPVPPNWPQYRGPNASGLASEDASPPVDFGPSRNLRWRVALPLGHGSPCIWGDRIFVTAFDSSARKLEVIALNRGTGSIVWRKAAPTAEFEVVHPISSPATSTPVTDGKRVYVYWSSYGVLAFEWDGALAWEYPMGVAKFNVPDGSGTSPILAGERIIVARDGPPHLQMLALHAATGKPAWTTKLEVSKAPGPKVAHATPVLYASGTAAPDGQIVLHRAGFVSGFDVSSGQLLWSLPTSSIGISTPTISGNLLFVHAVSAITNPGGAVPLPPFSKALDRFDSNTDGRLSAAELPPADLYFQKRPGVPDNTRGAHFTLKAFFFLFDRNRDGALDQPEYEAVKDFGNTIPEPRGLLAIRMTEGTATLAWSEARNVPEVTAPLVYQGRVYMVTGGGIVSCLDALTGKVVYRGRINAPGAYFASPVAASGRIYVASGEGLVTVLAGGDSLDILANNDLGEPIFGTPAPVGNSLYVRSTHHLWAFSPE